MVFMTYCFCAKISNDGDSGKGLGGFEGFKDLRPLRLQNVKTSMIKDGLVVTP